MNEQYHKTISELEQNQVLRDYILGWASGFLGNPAIEEQRQTDSWQAGYDDGKAKTTEQSGQWQDVASNEG